MRFKCEKQNHKASEGRHWSLSYISVKIPFKHRTKLEVTVPVNRVTQASHFHVGWRNTVTWVKHSRQSGKQCIPKASQVLHHWKNPAHLQTSLYKMLGTRNYSDLSVFHTLKYLNIYQGPWRWNPAWRETFLLHIFDLMVIYVLLFAINVPMFYTSRDHIWNSPLMSSCWQSECEIHLHRVWL